MILTFDVGNTNIKFGLWDKENLLGDWRVNTKRDLSGDELGFMVDGFLRIGNYSISQLEDMVVASVVPTMRPALERFSNKYLKKPPIFVEGHSQKMIKIDYSDPRQVGADRVVVSIAAWHRFHESLIVIDFGTATTFDCVSKDGVYLGGSIAPGFRLSAEALFSRAALLPKMENFYKALNAICKDTVNGLNSGLVLGYTGLVEGMVSRIKNEMGDDPKVVATGGLAALFANHTDVIDEVLPNLTLEGLKIVYDQKKW
ncbi:MAG: type III pantothenate kinase [Deltaproteobacteria bacterium]|jgi:type III pantothenate kinase|nr:type III pantothenate kinase [Deltaproteobacteria bacterium]